MEEKKIIQLDLIEKEKVKKNIKGRIPFPISHKR